MKNNKLNLLISLGLLLSSLCAVAMQRQMQAHVHGEANLLVVVEGNIVELQFLSPAMNLIGFEHPPQTSRQQQQLEQAVELLNQPGRLFSLPAAANCSIDRIDITAPFQEHAEPHATHAGHADFSTNYRYQCINGKRVKQLMLKLFEHFPLIEYIEVQSITAKGQNLREATAQDNIIGL